MTWQDDALTHAKNEVPRESVGLLLNIKGKQKYFPCRNLSLTDHQCFILDPEDYVKADNLGTVTAVVHSHPINPPTPSQADLIGCEQSGLEWHIVNPSTEIFMVAERAVGQAANDLRGEFGGKTRGDQGYHQWGATRTSRGSKFAAR